MHLTTEEINQIMKDAELNPDFTKDNIIHFGKSHSSVIKVSEQTGLILIEGNDLTGFQHINKRHGFYESRTDWNKGKLGTGSKFASNTLGYWDYLRIADQVYTPLNLVVDSKNNGYERYNATLTINGKTCVYRLLIYEGTKIIHNLFPEEDVSEWLRPYNFNFVRVGATVEVNYSKGTKSFTFKYKNKKDEFLFTILIIEDYHNKILSFSITDLKANTQIIYEEQPLPPLVFEQCTFDAVRYDAEDLTIWEQKILDHLSI